jgi:hypothetical protein
MIKIHTFFHEILGETQRPIELVFIILFALITTTFSFVFFSDFLRLLPILNQVILLLLTIDITGGVIANLTYGTNHYYSTRKKARLIFIIIHIQPILIFLFTNLPLWIGFILWVYTLFCALVLEQLKNHPSHKVFAGFDLFLGLVILFAFQSFITPFVTFLMILFLFKVLYSFSVNHYREIAHE